MIAVGHTAGGAGVHPGPWDEVVDLDVGGQRTRVARRHGDGGVPLVLVHCVALDHRMWEPFVAALDAPLDVVAYRVRNHGDEFTEPFTFEACATDLRDLADLLGLSRLHLAGISMGGAIAQEFAIRHGDRLAGLSVLASSGGGRKPTPSWAAVPDGLAHEATGMAQRWFTPGFAAAGGPWVDYVHERIAGWDPRSWAAAWEALAGRETLSRIGGVTAPTLCVAGEHDGATPHQRMVQLAEAMPGATLVTIPGPHLFPIEQPHALADVLVPHHRRLTA